MISAHVKKNNNNMHLLGSLLNMKDRIGKLTREHNLESLCKQAEVHPIVYLLEGGGLYKSAHDRFLCSEPIYELIA